MKWHVKCVRVFFLLTATDRYGGFHNSELIYAVAAISFDFKRQYGGFVSLLLVRGLVGLTMSSHWSDYFKVLSVERR